MCGLVGILRPNPIPDAAATLAAMNETLNHRGPDQTGIYIHPDGRVGLAHKRLSILDLTHGRQPMTDRDGHFTLVFNGEIYNHQDIKAELLAKGHPIASRSDTETLLYAFKEWGVECASRLRGMFAFAVLDHREGSIHLVRDRLGIKPMYYGFHDGAVIFASECKAILRYPGFDRAMDPQALSDYFTFLYVPAPKSIFKRIRKLPAGHWLRIGKDGSTESRQWWDLEFSDRAEGNQADFNRAAADLVSELDASVHCHMESDVPLGAFLSGGLDSSAVVDLMAKHSTRPVLTNTIGFQDKAHDERGRAARTAAHFHTDHQEFRVDPDAVKILEKLAWHYDEPFADSSMIPTSYVCEMARRRVTVALSGDGGDENFAGYRRYYFDRMENRMRSVVPGFLRRPLFGMAGGLYPKADWLPRMFRARTLLLNLAKDPMQGYFTSMSNILPEAKDALFSGEFLAGLGGYRSHSVFQEHWDRCKSADPLSRIQYLDYKTYLADGILTKVDRASMAHSLEVRVPILDHKVVEWAARQPSSWKLSGKTGKYLFREAFRSRLPAEILDGPKQGFSMPLRGWLRKDLLPLVQDAFFEPGGLAGSGLFRKPVLERMVKEHVSGLRNHDTGLFALLSLSMWNRHFRAF